MSIATIVKGNTFSLAIPLQVYAVEDGEVVLRDYIPENGDAITIRLKGDRRNYTYIPSTNGSTAFIHLEGSEVVGVYAVEVEIVKDDDSKLTSYRFDQLSIVESIDELSEGQITEGISQGAIYLDPEIFIAGKDGRGIVSITKTATSGLVDTYTITYTDNTTSTFNVANGSDATQVQSDWSQNDSSAVDYIKNKPAIDANPTQNSTNLVESGGVYTALNTKQDKMLIATVTITSTDGFTYYNGTLDKTHSEIFAAMQANKNVYIYIPTLFNGTYVLLSEITANNNHHFIVVINGDLWWFVSSTNDLDNSCNLYKFNYQAALVSGTNIKTINNSSILSSGNIDLVPTSTFNSFCPIIEDTRSSAVATITGVAPFSELVDGQRIMLKVAQNIPNSPTLTLTLSGGSATSAIPMYTNYQSTPLTTVWNNNIRAGSYIEMVYESANNRWIMVGQKDSNTTYSNIEQSTINAGTETYQKTVSALIMHDNCYIVDVPYTSSITALKANKFYDFGTVSSALTIPSLDATNDLVSNALNFYALRFIAGADNLNITFPTGVLVDDEPTINTGDYVEIMINLYVINGSNNFYASIKVWQAQ